MSEIAASSVGQRSMTSLNDVGVTIESRLGQFGLFGKAIMARDSAPATADNFGMNSKAKSETQEKLAFIARVKLARMSRFADQKPICTILGIEQGTYKHYEARTPLPHRFIPKFVAATGVSFEWLLSGLGKAPVALEEAVKPARSARKRKRAAA
jgi:hypothetical protein